MIKAKKKSVTAHLKPHQFKPGTTGNPNGRPPLTAVQRELRKLTIEKYREVIELALTGNLEELKAFIADPDTSVIQVGVGTALLTAIKKGDASVLEQFAARIVGKIPDEIRINSNSNMNINAGVSVLTDEQLKERLRKIRSEL